MLAATLMCWGGTAAAADQNVCGLACPSGTYPVYSSSSPSCGGYQTTCRTVSGSPLYTCEDHCPPNYVPTATSTNYGCGNGFANIQTTCNVVSGPTVETCFTQCPSGYYAASTRTDFQCGNPYGNIKTTCNIVTGTVLGTCEDHCPTNYYPTATSTDYGCGRPYFNVKTTCSVPSGSQFNVCGTNSCPPAPWQYAGNFTNYNCGNVYLNTASSCTRDIQLPTVSINSPGDEQSVSGTVSFTAYASDNVGVTKVEYWTVGVLGTATASPWRVDIATSGGQYEGVYYPVTAKAYDAAGNVRTSSPILLIVNNRATSGRIIWVQPQSTAGYGPPGSLVVAGSASGGAPALGVVLKWRNVTQGGTWQRDTSFFPRPDSSGTWLHSIPNANPAHVYDVQMKYGNTTASCRYQGTSGITWCP